MSYDSLDELDRLDEILTEESLDELLTLVGAMSELPTQTEQELRTKIWEFFSKFKDYGFDAVIIMMSDGTPVLYEYNREIIDKVRQVQEVNLDPARAAGYIGIIVGIYDNAEKALMQIAREPAMRVVIEGKYGYVIIRRVPGIEDLVIAASVYIGGGIPDSLEGSRSAVKRGGFPLGVYLVAFNELVQMLEEPLKKRRMGE
jgi:hypothetical protein